MVEVIGKSTQNGAGRKALIDTHAGGKNKSNGRKQLIQVHRKNRQKRDARKPLIETQEDECQKEARPDETIGRFIASLGEYC